MPATYTCDICDSDDGAYEDWDGEILCEYHRKQSELRSLEIEYQEKKKRVKECWISELVKMRNEIKELRDYLGQITRQ